jgi:hypothetical protein
MYTHDRLWPEMKDVAQAIGSQCNLLAPQSGGNPFDEALSGPWAVIADTFPAHSIPMACHCATIELRGESEVCTVAEWLIGCCVDLSYDATVTTAGL